jgi:hypothetical protein
MCGRFTNRLTWREIVALYRLTVPATPERNLQARYNIWYRFSALFYCRAGCLHSRSRGGPLVVPLVISHFTV